MSRAGRQLDPRWASLVPIMVLMCSRAAADPASFAAPRMLTSGGAALNIALGDANGDSRNDIVVAPVSGELRTYLSGPELTFTEVYTDARNTSGTRCNAVGDLNGDGTLDVAVAGGSTLRIFLGDGLGGFLTPATDYDVGHLFSGVLLADVDDDDDLDVILGAGGEYVPIDVYYNDGEGMLNRGGASPPLYSGGQNFAVDLTGDGLADLVVFERTWSMRVLHQGPPGTFTLAHSESLPINTVEACIGHFNGDAYIDVAIACFSEESLRIFFGRAGGTFDPSFPVSVGSGMAFATAAADFNCDGFDDIAVSRLAARDIVVFESDGHGGFSPVVSLPATDPTTVGIPSTLEAGDLDGDGSQEIVAGLEWSNLVAVYRNTSTGCTAHPPVAIAVADPQALDEGDVGHLDGRASFDPDRGNLTYIWTEVTHFNVHLDVTDPSRPGYMAPQVPLGGATLTFSLVVTDPSSLRSQPVLVDVVVRNVNGPPVAELSCDSPVGEEALVQLSATASWDPNSDELAYSVRQTSGPSVQLTDEHGATPSFYAPQVDPEGAHLEFELTVSDGELSDTATCTVRVENVNHRPLADAGEAKTVDEASPFQLDSSGSSDPDDDLLSYSWELISGAPGTIVNPDAPMATALAPVTGSAGATLIYRLTVTDPLGLSDTDTVTVTVRDSNAPPSCGQARPSSTVLWPPNHVMTPVELVGLVDPDADAVLVQWLSVQQDEPVSGLGDGDTGPDATVIGDMLWLRAERSGTGNGRVYVARFRAIDRLGQDCEGTVSVCVPRARSSAGCADDGATFSSQ